MVVVHPTGSGAECPQSVGFASGSSHMTITSVPSGWVTRFGTSTVPGVGAWIGRAASQVCPSSVDLTNHVAVSVVHAAATACGCLGSAESVGEPPYPSAGALMKVGVDHVAPPSSEV